MPDKIRDYQLAVDSFVHKNGRFFGWGWFIHTESATCRIELVSISNGKTTNFPVIINLPREDIKNRFPAVHSAESSGFRISGFQEQDTDVLWLFVVTLLNGETLTIPLPMSNRGVRPGLKYTIKKIYRLVRQGKYQEILDKATTRLNLLKSDISWLEHNSRNKNVLIFDHGLGGGTSKYAEQRVRQYLDSGNGILMVHFDLPTLTPSVTYRYKKDKRRIRIKHEAEIFHLAGLIGVTEIFINHVIGFSSIPGILEAALSYKKKHNGTIEYPLHDFLPVCPAWHLIDYQGVFCNIPDVEHCYKCLAGSTEEFTAYIPVEERNIKSWRSHWESFLNETDLIRAFSASSVKLLLKAYPELSGKQIRITPHTLDSSFAPLELSDINQHLRIAIVGTIGYVKGAKVILEMCELIISRNIDIHIVVVGNLEGNYHQFEKHGILTVTGRYEADNLPDILKYHKVNYSFLPSIWPETFSFVISELMALNLPVAVFDLGAPSERVANYKNGLIIPEITPDKALDSILLHAEKLRACRKGTDL